MLAVLWAPQIIGRLFLTKLTSAARGPMQLSWCGDEQMDTSDAARK